MDSLACDRCRGCDTGHHLPTQEGTLGTMAVGIIGGIRAIAGQLKETPA